MLSIPKYPEQYAQHFPTIFYLLCCASQHHVSPTCLDRLKHKWRDEMGTEGLLNDDEARTEACMLSFPAG